MKFYIADTHFGHENCIRFDERPFSDVDEMDRILIMNWNVRVQPEDEVYILGDFAYRNEKHDFEWYLKQLNGIKYFVIGNHDGKLLRDERAMSYFKEVDKMMHVMDDRNSICLCHFPIAEWNGYHKGHYHIYGHIHKDRGDTFEFMKSRARALNAGCMLNGYMPVTFKELIQNNERFRKEH